MSSLNERKSLVYRKLILDFRALLSLEQPWESRFATLIALLKERLSTLSWIGLYRESPVGSGNLWVGPYQGKVACTFIPAGKGVCGTSFQMNQILIVPDVEKFPGHIACDAASRSEIVLPVRHEGRTVGVLDLDSYELAAFDETDSRFLQELLEVLNPS